MTENVTNELILEHLKSIRSELKHLNENQTDMAADLRIVKSHMAAFMQAEIRHDGTIAALQVRMDRIERRLEIRD